MDRYTLSLAFALIALVIVCLTVLAAIKVIPGDPLVHLAGVIVGGILGLLSPSIINRTTTTPLGTTVHSEKVG